MTATRHSSLFYRWERELEEAATLRVLPKDGAPCCEAHRLPDGRPVIGFCGPDCQRRPIPRART